MSFLGAIGALMDDSGLREIFELIYADTGVLHMPIGKAGSRAVLGYLLVDAAHNALLLSKVYGVALPRKDAKQEDTLFEERQQNIVKEESMDEAQNFQQDTVSNDNSVRPREIKITFLETSGLFFRAMVP